MSNDLSSILARHNLKGINVANFSTGGNSLRQNQPSASQHQAYQYPVPVPQQQYQYPLQPTPAPQQRTQYTWSGVPCAATAKPSFAWPAPKQPRYTIDPRHYSYDIWGKAPVFSLNGEDEDEGEAEEDDVVEGEEGVEAEPEGVDDGAEVGESIDDKAGEGATVEGMVEVAREEIPPPSEEPGLDATAQSAEESSPGVPVEEPSSDPPQDEAHHTISTEPEQPTEVAIVVAPEDTTPETPSDPMASEASSGIPTEEAVQEPALDAIQSMEPDNQTSGESIEAANTAVEESAAYQEAGTDAPVEGSSPDPISEPEPILEEQVDIPQQPGANTEKATAEDIQDSVETSDAQSDNTPAADASSGEMSQDAPPSHDIPAVEQLDTAKDDATPLSTQEIGSDEEATAKLHTTEDSPPVKPNDIVQVVDVGNDGSTDDTEAIVVLDVAPSNTVGILDTPPPPPPPVPHVTIAEPPKLSKPTKTKLSSSKPSKSRGGHDKARVISADKPVEIIQLKEGKSKTTAKTKSKSKKSKTKSRKGEVNDVEGELVPPPPPPMIVDVPPPAPSPPPSGCVIEVIGNEEVQVIDEAEGKEDAHEDSVESSPASDHAEAEMEAADVVVVEPKHGDEVACQEASDHVVSPPTARLEAESEIAEVIEAPEASVVVVPQPEEENADTSAHNVESGTPPDVEAIVPQTEGTDQQVIDDHADDEDKHGPTHEDATSEQPESGIQADVSPEDVSTDDGAASPEIIPTEEENHDKSQLVTAEEPVDSAITHTSTEGASESETLCAPTSADPIAEKPKEIDESSDSTPEDDAHSHDVMDRGADEAVSAESPTEPPIAEIITPGTSEDTPLSGAIENDATPSVDKEDSSALVQELPHTSAETVAESVPTLMELAALILPSDPVVECAEDPVEAVPGPAIEAVVSEDIIADGQEPDQGCSDSTDDGGNKADAQTEEIDVADQTVVDESAASSDSKAPSTLDEETPQGDVTISFDDVGIQGEKETGESEQNKAAEVLGVPEAAEREELVSSAPAVQEPAAINTAETEDMAPDQGAEQVENDEEPTKETTSCDMDNVVLSSPAAPTVEQESGEGVGVTPSPESVLEDASARDEAAGVPKEENPSGGAVDMAGDITNQPTTDETGVKKPAVEHSNTQELAAEALAGDLQARELASDTAKDVVGADSAVDNEAPAGEPCVVESAEGACELPEEQSPPKLAEGALGDEFSEQPTEVAVETILEQPTDASSSLNAAQDAPSSTIATSAQAEDQVSPELSVPVLAEEAQAEEEVTEIVEETTPEDLSQPEDGETKEVKETVDNVPLLGETPEPNVESSPGEPAISTAEEVAIELLGLEEPAVSLAPTEEAQPAEPKEPEHPAQEPIAEPEVMPEDSISQQSRCRTISDSDSGRRSPPIEESVQGPAQESVQEPVQEPAQPEATAPSASKHSSKVSIDEPPPSPKDKESASPLKERRKSSKSSSHHHSSSRHKVKDVSRPPSDPKPPPPPPAQSRRRDSKATAPPPGLFRKPSTTTKPRSSRTEAAEQAEIRRRAADLAAREEEVQRRLERARKRAALEEQERRLREKEAELARFQAAEKEKKKAKREEQRRREREAFERERMARERAEEEARAKEIERAERHRRRRESQSSGDRHRDERPRALTQSSLRDPEARGTPRAPEPKRTRRRAEDLSPERQRPRDEYYVREAPSSSRSPEDRRHRRSSRRVPERDEKPKKSIWKSLVAKLS